MDYADDFEQTLKGGDPTLRVRFELVSKEREPTAEEIEQHGDRPRFDDVIYIEKRVPGDERNIVHKPASAKDKRQFAREWKAFEAARAAGGKGANGLGGTPLAMWPPCSPATIKTLNYGGIYTVEEFAALSDSVVSGLSMSALRGRAQAWLEDAKTGAAAAKALKERDEARSEIESLKDQVAQLVKATQAQTEKATQDNQKRK